MSRCATGIRADTPALGAAISVGHAALSHRRLDIWHRYVVKVVGEKIRGRVKLAQHLQGVSDGGFPCGFP